MGFFEKFMGAFKLNDDEYYDDGMGYDDYQDVGYVEGNTVTAPMYRTADAYYEEPKKKKEAKKAAHKVTPFKKNASNAYSTQVRVIKPVNMEDCKDIADILLSGTVVLINYATVREEGLSQRISDFVLGVVYSINGRFEKIAENIFIAVPAGVGLDGDLYDVMNQ